VYFPITCPYLFQLLRNYLKAVEGSRALQNKSNILSLLAECQQRIGNFNKSEEYFKAALGLNTENLGIRNNYAYYLALQGRELQWAKELSKKTIQVEPKNPTYLDTYGWVLFKLNKVRGARKYISLAISYGGSKNSEILLHYGEVMLRLNRNQEALDTWKAALEYASEGERVELRNRIAEVEGMVKK
jgi:tetratricopeptide (TPR) repeat protein